MIRKKYLLKKITTIGVGPVCDILIPENNEDFKNLPSNIFILGGGSNILVNEKSSAVMVKLELNKELEIKNNILKAGAGVNLKKILSFSIKNNISGFEFLAGIPGTVGGAAAMNAGNISKLINRIFYYDLKNKKFSWLNKSECFFSYRNSTFKNNNKVIISVEFFIEKSNIINIKEKIKIKFIKKLSSQPVLKKTFGSVFKNPEGYSAWKLIEKAGLAGFKYGGAGISQKHLNFIENMDNAGFLEIKYIIDFCKKEVFKKTGIKLEEEVVII
ncbi:MAG: UDP-N-acetylmuramate dehydrogenase [Candidatus Muiribacteriota bacterium]